ncbi:putative Glycosyl transferase, group 1 family protein [groundwater metagenome]|uniref:Putative Glycosyl transferase, group 1 family protein n=1 Tax=groundwater metagenome TaxID=717931 RepID=A0A098EAW3_9ZZZZ
MKVLILGLYPFIEGNIMNGVEAHITGIVNELKKYKDINLYVLSPQSETGKRLKEITKIFKLKEITKVTDNVTVTYLSLVGDFFTMTTIDRYKIIRKIKELKPDIIHAHSTFGYYALKSGFPSITTIHGVNFVEGDPKMAKLDHLIERKIIYPIRFKTILSLDNYIFKNAKVLTVVSPYVKKEIEKYCKGEIYVIPNRISDEYFNVENREVENRLLFVGGISPRKDILTLLKAVKIVKNEIPNINLHIVGHINSEVYYSSLIDYVRKNNLEKNVIFKIGLNNEEAKNEFSECLVFVFPSIAESFGIVLAEAGACGKPVVASNVGGIPYVVEDNKNGFLVECENAEKFAEKILLLLNDKNLRMKMGNAWQEKAKEFSNKEIVKKYYELYKYVIKNEKIAINVERMRY